MAKRFYNAHLHCFTYDHVPEYFLSRDAGISRLLKSKVIQHIIQSGVEKGKLGTSLRILVWLLNKIFGIDEKVILRYISFIRLGDQKNQQDVIEEVQQYYPANTGFVLLTMDMEYMGAGQPKTSFKNQLAELATVKNSSKFNNFIFPFIFCDPRRIEPVHPREIPIEKDFIGETFLKTVRGYVNAGVYSGIKLYPALGYHAFDQRLKPIYDYALSLNLPCLTHCTVGAVHFKYELDNDEYFHPFLMRSLPHSNPKEFQQYFTHPLNYECLLNYDLLKTFWGSDAPDYRELKICIAHWGTEEEWHRYLDDPWLGTKLPKSDSPHPTLELANWNPENPDRGYHLSWFSIISDLIRKYPNVYTDISYTLNDSSLLPLLKMTLESDSKIRERVLFGTDFYMVSKAISERAFAINVRAALGNELFDQIAIINTERFLSNKLYPVPLEW